MLMGIEAFKQGQGSEKKHTCHSKGSCSHTKFTKVIDYFGDLPKNADIDFARGVLEDNLDIKNVNGLYLIASKHEEEEGILVGCLDTNRILLQYTQFPESITECARGSYMWDKIQKFQDLSNPVLTYAITNLRMSCCINESKTNGNLIKIIKKND